MKLNSKATGCTIAVIGVLAAGPDAGYLRAQREAGGSMTVISVWRYAILAVCNLFLGAAFEGGFSVVVSGMWRSLVPVVGASLIIVCINVGMTASLLMVEPAFALLLMSLSPLWAALMGSLLLGDPLPMRTCVAQALSLLSTIIVFVPSLRKLLTPKHPEHQHADLWDPIELVPLATGFAVAVLLTYSRWQAHASLEMAPALGAALTAAAAAVVMFVIEQQPPSDLVDGLAPTFWVALLLMAGGCAIYDSALVLAPRSLTAGEVALILLAETIIGPLSVWSLFGDMPGRWTLAGGALLLLTLIGHQIVGMRAGEAEKLFDAGAGAHRSPRLSPRFSASPRLGRGKPDVDRSFITVMNGVEQGSLRDPLHTPMVVDVVEDVHPRRAPHTYTPPRVAAEQRV